MNNEPDRCGVDAVHFRQFSLIAKSQLKEQSNSIHFALSETSSARVDALNKRRRPDTVSWRIAFVVIFPLDRMASAWPPTHIGEEVRVCHPGRANRNPPSAVVVKARVLRVETTLFQICPDFIFRAAIIGAAMRPATFVPAKLWTHPCRFSPPVYGGKVDKLNKESLGPLACRRSRRPEMLGSPRIFCKHGRAAEVRNRGARVMGEEVQVCLRSSSI